MFSVPPLSLGTVFLKVKVFACSDMSTVSKGCTNFFSPHASARSFHINNQIRGNWNLTNQNQHGFVFQLCWLRAILYLKRNDVCCMRNFPFSFAIYKTSEKIPQSQRCGFKTNKSSCEVRLQLHLCTSRKVEETSNECFSKIHHAASLTLPAEPLLRHTMSGSVFPVTPEPRASQIKGRLCTHCHMLGCWLNRHTSRCPCWSTEEIGQRRRGRSSRDLRGWIHAHRRQ